MSPAPLPAVSSNPTKTNASNGKSRAVPVMRRHCRGAALVRVDGRDVWLGRFGTPEAEKKYNQIIAEWLANGGRLPGVAPAVGTATGGEEAGIDLAEIIELYLEYCDREYRRPDGTPTGEKETIRRAMRPLEPFLALPASSFGPKALKQVREGMIRDGWCRNSVNRQTLRVKAMLKWAVAEELIPVTIYQALQTVRALGPGKSEARETEPVRPVPAPQLSAVLPFLSRQVAAMVQVQLLSGARPGEICRLRAADLVMTGPVWVYEPAQHKTAHHGKVRRIPLGPKAQEILRPFLVGNPAEPLFRPCDALREYNEARQHPARKLSPSARLKRRRQRSQGQAGKMYAEGSYTRAIARACDQAFPPPAELSRGEGETLAQWQARLTTPQRAELRAWRKAHRWAPNRLRHNAATELRKQFGSETAQIVLGHSKLNTTEIYAERDWQALERVMGQVG